MFWLFTSAMLSPSGAQDVATTRQPLCSPPTPGRFKMALCQLLVGSDKETNLLHAEASVREAVKGGAEFVVLPECFNSPYGANFFPEYAEEVPNDLSELQPSAHPSTSMLSRLAAELQIYLVGGSIPERDASSGKLYNTCIAFGPDGTILAKHRKVHLFDIDVPGKITFFESKTLAAPQPEALSVFDTQWGRVGLGICYDIRFPEMATLMRESGAHMLVYPGAFNTVTGPMHWDLLARARAVDTQCFVAVASPARNPESGYQAWGHSSIVSPWGEVVATTDEAAAIVYADVDLSLVDEPRSSIPVFDQRRRDLYDLRWIG